MYIVKRDVRNPILVPREAVAWESRGAFNGCPVLHKGSVQMLYRALGKPEHIDHPANDVSVVGIATQDGSGGFSNRRPFITPEKEWEKFGCEDPRVTFFEGQYVIFYTALGGYPYNASNIKVGMALSPDLNTITEKHLVTPFNAKAMMLFPERIGKKIVAILTAHTDEPPARMALVRCDSLEQLTDPKFWEEWHAQLPNHVINPLRGEHDHVEAGAPPIKTKDGWLLIYSYIQNYTGGGKPVFGIEALLLDLRDPGTVIGRTKGPMLVPEASYEQYGAVPNIVFPTGALVDGDRLDIYYGAADTVCARASIHLPDLLDAIVPARRAAIGVRARNNPIITPSGDHPWESKATFNPAAIDINGTAHILYRALSQDNVSTFGYAISRNGTSITKRFSEPAYIPREDFELKHGGDNNYSGCEDPRLTRIGDKIYVTYTAFDGAHPWHAAIASISVKDFLARKFDKWSMPQLVTPEPIKDKDLCLLPGKIDGKYMFIHRTDNSGSVCADTVETLDFSKNRLERCIELLAPREGMWDGVKVGVAAPPVLTKKGWLMIYHGVSRTSSYRLGAALLDAKDPTIVLARLTDAIFEPVEQYELTGEVPHVVFSCGMVVRKDTLFLYYGAADRVVGVAKFSLKKLLSALSPPSCCEA